MEETLEEYFLGKMKEVLLFDNDAQAIRFMEKYFEAKLQQEKMYSEQEVLQQLNLLYGMKNSLVDTFTDKNDYITMKWFEQFKNK